MTNVAIVYFSGYGHTAKLAEAVADGVHAIEGAIATMYSIPESGDIPETWIDELGEADAIVYGSPTYMGSVA